MHRMLGALAALYRRWKFVEEGPASASVNKAPLVESEPDRTRRAIDRGERRLADYQRNGCVALARECETSLRSLRTHLAALEF
jgi:hypothetical protein